MKIRLFSDNNRACRQVLECGSPLPLIAASGLPHPPQSARGLFPLPSSCGADSAAPKVPAIPAWANGPGQDVLRRRGLKARPMRPRRAPDESGLEPFGSLAPATWAAGPGWYEHWPLALKRTLGLVGKRKRGLAHFKTLARASQAAFTRLDLLATLLVLALCAAVMLPALASNRPRSHRVLCASNLRQIGNAFNLWGSDHGDRIPYTVALNEGGTALHPLGVNPWLHFSWISNELSTPAILLCPSDTGRPARDFSADPNGGYLHPNFANAATSYALSHGEYGSGLTMVSFDRNLGYDAIGNCPFFSRVWFLGVNWTLPPSPNLRWDDKLHVASGNILRLGGHVDQVSNAGLPSAFTFPTDDNNGTKHFIKPR